MPTGESQQQAEAKDSSIYTLSDPRTGEVRYVGVAKHPKRRLWRHIDDAGWRTAPGVRSKQFRRG